MAHPALPADQPTEVFVDATWGPSSDGSTFEVRNPATEAVLAVVADATAQDGRRALATAHAAQPAWAATPARVRAELLRAAYETVVARADDFAAVMTLEMGKPLAEARGEVTYAAEFLRWFSEEAPRVAGRYQTSPEGTMRQLVLRRPVGPCLFVTPWNTPFMLESWKLAPALASGCTVVLKPAEFTPLSASLWAEIFESAGLPPGVFNLVGGLGEAAGDALVKHPDVNLISFTGETTTGQLIFRNCAATLKGMSMELGGKSPAVVFDDADLDAAIDSTLFGVFSLNGERCTARSMSSACPAAAVV